jgi:predicted Zn-dependent protease
VLRRPLAALGYLWRRPVVLVAVLLGLAVLGGVGYVVGRQAWAQWHLYRARQEMAKYHAGVARHHLDACLEVWPNDPATVLLAARAARQDDDLDAAEKLLWRYESLPGYDREAFEFELTLFQASAGNLLQVENYLVRVLSGEPNDERDALILEALITGCIRLYRRNDAFHYAERWLNRSTDNTRALTLVGRAMELNTGFESSKAAAQVYGRVLELDPDNDPVRMALSHCLQETDRDDDAIEQLEELRRRQPDNPEVLSRLGYSMGRKNKLDQAEDLLRQAMELRPDYYPAYRIKAKLALQTGRPQEAEQWLRKTLEHDSHNRLVLMLLIQALQQQKRTEDADRLTAQLQQIEADLMRMHDIMGQMSTKVNSPELQAEMGELSVRVGKADLGYRWLMSAVQLDPNNVRANRALASYFQERGDTTRAEMHRQRAADAEAAGHGKKSGSPKGKGSPPTKGAKAPAGSPPGG